MRQVYFDGLGSFDHYGLRFVQFELAEPEPKTYYVSVPFGDGQLDMTEFMTGEPKFHPRQLITEHYLKPNQWIHPDNLNAVRAAMHGQRLTIVDSKEPDAVLTGRCQVFSQMDGSIQRVRIEAVCDPYKLKKEKTVRTVTIGSSGSASITIMNSRMTTRPQFTTTGSVAITLGQTTKNVNAGTYTFPEFTLTEGSNVVSVTGSGGTKVTIAFQEGWL